MSAPREGSVLGTATSTLPHPATVAFYLPQFHPIAENDAAWGAGFTEWHNVVRARPWYRGHEQPVLPGALGFYDLRLDETRRQQMALAREYRVDGFCWYHYWFSGRRLLEEPFARMRQDPEEDLPFMLCWANGPWTREWTGKSGEVIVGQEYSRQDDIRHIEYLLDVFADPRYILLDGKPVLVLFCPTDLPDMAATSDLWRAAAERAGFPGLVLLGVESFRSRIDRPEALGLDGIVDWQPNLRTVRPWWRAAPRVAASKTGVMSRYPKVVRYDYAQLADRAIDALEHADDPGRFTTVCPAWDNTPRRTRGAVVLTGATPEAYADWLERALRATTSPVVFVNAWNEWGEGAYLEPDMAHGTAYLDAHRRAVTRAGMRGGLPSVALDGSATVPDPRGVHTDGVRDAPDGTPDPDRGSPVPD